MRKPTRHKRRRTAARTAVSMPESILRKGREQATRQGRSLSNYVARLIEQDYVAAEPAEVAKAS